MNRSYANDQFGHGGIVAGLRDAAAKPGSVARFEVVDHPAHGNKVYARVGVGFEERGPDGRPSWRFAGIDNRLDGTGSYALLPSWNPDQSLAAAAAALAMSLQRAAKGAENAVVFRGPDLPVQAEVLTGDLNRTLDHLFGDVLGQLSALGVRK